MAEAKPKREERAEGKAALFRPEGENAATYLPSARDELRIARPSVSEALSVAKPV